VNLVAVLVLLAVLGVVAAVVTGAIRADMDEPTSSLPPAGVPDGDLVAEDLQAVRFSLGFRGYRMDEVDQVLDRAAVELARRDAEIERLRGRLSHDAARAGAAAHTRENGSAGTGWSEVPEHHGRHLRADVQSTDVHSTDERARDDVRNEPPRGPDRPSAGERGSDGHPTAGHPTDGHPTDGATAASVAPASGRPEWSTSEGT
jgi:DivIVA domain-containing protein